MRVHGCLWTWACVCVRLVQKIRHMPTEWCIMEFHMEKLTPCADFDVQINMKLSFQASNILEMLWYDVNVNVDTHKNHLFIFSLSLYLFCVCTLPIRVLVCFNLLCHGCHTINRHIFPSEEDRWLMRSVIHFSREIIGFLDLYWVDYLCQVCR